MKTHEVVECLEEDAENLAVLTGEILATLVVNIQRGAIAFRGDLEHTEFAKLQEQWENRYRRYAASIGDCTRVTFYPKPSEEDRPTLERI